MPTLNDKKRLVTPLAESVANFWVRHLHRRILTVAFLLLAARAATAQTNGSVWAWGWNGVGQCNIPTPNSGFIAIAGGADQSMGLRSDGSIVSWGAGPGSPPDPNTGFVGIAASTYDSLALREDGSIFAWGSNDYGQGDVPEPNEGYIAIAAGVTHSLGLRNDGSIEAWGYNANGQCDVPAPNSEFTAIAGGVEHSLGLRMDGSIVAWGHNGYGQCNVPPPNGGFVDIAAGWNHSVGLKSDGSIVAWGSNTDGQCDVPAPNTSFTAVAAGAAHTLALSIDGRIEAWGNNYYGQCNVPAPNSGFSAVGAGWYHSLAMKQNAAPPIASGIIGAVSRKVHAGLGSRGIGINLAGRVQDQNVTSEPRAGGVSELRLMFYVAPGGPGREPVAIHEQSCPGGTPEAYQSYSGSAQASAFIENTELVVNFAPGLENGRTYKLVVGPEVTTLPGQWIEVRSLSGDVNDDGFVNASDRSTVIGVWTGGGISNRTDLNLSGQTNGADRSVVVGAWTGTQNCAP